MYKSDRELEAIRRIMIELRRIPLEARGRILDYARQRSSSPELDAGPLYPVSVDVGAYANLDEE